MTNRGPFLTSRNSGRNCSAFVAAGRLGNLVEDLSLVVQVDRDGLQGLLMFTGVMGAKQQFAARGQDRAKVRASTASVASIRGRQGSCCQYRCHRHVLLIGCLIVNATTTSSQNFPRRR